MLHAIASAFIGAVTFIGSLFGIPQAPVQAPAVEQTLGTALPSGTAVFETSLQSRISSTDTSMTLVANSVRGGSSLSGFQCFTVDEGRTDAEYICGSISGTSVTGLTRGIDPSTGTTSNSALKFAHRVGSNVKITDFPLLQILRNQANGTETYPSTLRYASGVTLTNPSDLTDKEYADSLAFSGAGIIDATSVSKGVSELANGCEAASSTISGGSGPLVIPAGLASSTYNAATAACIIVSTSNTGLIDQGFIPASTTKAMTFASSTYINQTPILDIGKTLQVFSSTGTTTFSVPAGVGRVCAQVQAAGAAGSGATDNSSGRGLGGGGGGYTYGCFSVAGTTTIQVFVGTGGVGTTGSGASGGWSTFGTNGFYLSATGGAGSTGGCGTGGSFNQCGENGSSAVNDASEGIYMSGEGGDSFLGFGAPTVESANTAGSAGTNYGGGGSGAMTNAAPDQTGGNGAQGIVIVQY